MEDIVMSVNPRRMLSPHPAFARAKVEPIHQPLYSMASLNNAALPAVVAFFGYGIGGIVSNSGVIAVGTNTTATQLHTNMLQGGVLSMPKLFLVQGLRFVYPLLDVGLTNLQDLTVGAVNAPLPSADNLKMVTYGTVTVLHVGTKDYIRTPTVNIPGNTGIGGLAGLAASALNELGQTTHAPMTAGKYFSLPTYPILIPSQQSFTVEMRAPQAAPPVLTIELSVYMIKDGILGRETQ